MRHSCSQEIHVFLGMDLSRAKQMHLLTSDFSSDMVLLSRIRREQGRLDDAVRLSSKSLTFRQGLLGNTLKTCDSMCLTAKLLRERGDIASAM